ncbi:winged helix-turn-helix domain-containing protein [Enterococcus sp. DIV0800]|uniref:winged helix-turn-helix domain-containing protein n=1 Tax=unclassified Enterococcus TaxID=2608891 RepID=UPI003D300003
MVRVLVLTKNILAEEVITKKLQHLNYEVFCSTSILDELQSTGHMSELVNYFPIIIIGETISSYELEIMLPKLKKQGQRILREMDHPLSEDEKGQLLNHGLSGYVQSNDSIESLRENLAEVMASYQNHEPGEVEAYLEEEPRGISAITLINLSTLELQVLEKLRSKPGEIISRDELCMTLWGNVSQSRLAQLSSLVKNIKLKLEMLEIDKEVIQTIWGKGYRVMQDSIVQNK